MKKILVTGGTGNLGRVIVNKLAENRLDVSVLTSNELPNSNIVKFIKGDLTKKESLIAIKNKFNIIVHCASNPLDYEAVDISGSQNLLDIVLSDKIKHFVYISILGVDKSSYKYYQSKTQVENLIKESNIPYTIIRATQFHDLVLQRIIKPICGEKRTKLEIPKNLCFQSIDKMDVAQKVCTIVEEGPSDRTINIGGPEILTLDEMLRIYLSLAQLDGKVELIPPTTEFQKIFTTGINLCPDNIYGTITWREYLNNVLNENH